MQLFKHFKGCGFGLLCRVPEQKCLLPLQCRLLPSQWVATLTIAELRLIYTLTQILIVDRYRCQSSKTDYRRRGLGKDLDMFDFFFNYNLHIGSFPLKYYDFKMRMNVIWYCLICWLCTFFIKQWDVKTCNLQ